MRLALRLAKTEPFSSCLIPHDGTIEEGFDPYWAAKVDPDTLTDDQLETLIRRHAQSAWHPVCLQSLQLCERLTHQLGFWQHYRLAQSEWGPTLQ